MYANDYSMEKYGSPSSLFELLRLELRGVFYRFCEAILVVKYH